MESANAQLTMPGGITPSARIRAAEACRQAKWSPHICDEIAAGQHDGYVIVQACAHIERLEGAILTYEDSRHEFEKSSFWEDDEFMEISGRYGLMKTRLHITMTEGFPK